MATNVQRSCENYATMWQLRCMHAICLWLCGIT